MYFIGGGVRAALPADNTPAQRKTPLKPPPPPPKTPPLFKFGSGGVLSRNSISEKPPLPYWLHPGALVATKSITVAMTLPMALSGFVS